MVVLNTESCRTGTVEHSLYIGTVTFISGRPRASELQVTIDREEERVLVFTAVHLDNKARCYISIDTGYGAFLV